ncbi:hemicentin-2-like isoform X1 [Ornithodoros turicata]|uniref:hemicentin-2-like isoform X1 n=1 Tax=Ornithodoros turicata TaxID=34597 RepID=UPI0031386E53
MVASSGHRQCLRPSRTRCVTTRAYCGLSVTSGIVVWCFVCLVGLTPDAISAEETTVTGLVGDSVKLPCDVDTKRCGNVYFITWTKNVADVWKRIYLYSDAVEKPLQELANPDRADFFLNNSTAILKISPVRLADEGQYKCDVTYVRGKCPSLSYANLTTVAKPSVPVIETKGSTLETGAVVGPLQEGDVLTITCKTFGGKPSPKVTWYKGGSPLPAKVEEAKNERGAGDVKATFTTALRRQDLGSKYECVTTNEALDQPLKTWVELDLHVKPEELETDVPTMPIKAGTVLRVKCVVSGARPAADATWYNRTERMKHQPQPMVEPLGDGTFRTTSTLEVVVSRHDHEGSFTCKGSNSVLHSSGEAPLEKTIDLLVQYPPDVKIEQSRSGVVKERAHVVLHCSYIANPRMILDMRWYKDDALLHIDQDERLEISNPGLPTLTIRELTRYDRGRYGCGLKNEIGWGNSSNTAHLDILYSPTVAAVVSPPFLQEGYGTRVTLSCNVLEGNPGTLRRVSWYKNGELLNETTERVIVWMDVMRNFTGNYSCAGENDAGWGPVSDPQELIVYYPPGPTRVVHMSEFAIKGEPTSLSCVVDDPGLPPATHYRWEFQGNVSNTQTDSIFTTEPTSLSSRGNYSCAAVNDVGAGPSGEYELRVQAPPDFIEPLPIETGALQNASDVSLSCRVECEPTCVIDWLRAGELIDKYNPQFTIQMTPHPIEPKENHFASVVSTLKFNMTLWPGGVLDRVTDNTTFTCRSTGNLVGKGVSSTTHFQVQYPPEDIWVSSFHVTVAEGNTSEPITCGAQSRPASQYRWIYQNQTISDSPHLFMNYSLGRERTGNYTCVAMNRHGSASANTFINVTYAPSCTLYTSKNDEGQTTIICEVDANPPRVNIIWMRGNETIEDHIYTEGLRSVHTLTDSSVTEQYGTYFCLPNGTLGAAECKQTINALGGAYNHVYLDDEQVMMITGIAGLIVLIFIIIIVILVLIMKRRRKRDLNSPAKAKVAAEPLYQNVEGTKTENGPPPLGNEAENRAMYENMPFHPQRNPKGPPSTASTVTTDSTATTIISDSGPNVRGGNNSPHVTQQAKKPPHYVNVLPRSMMDPTMSSINGVGLPPPRPRTTKPVSHAVISPSSKGAAVGSLGRRSVTLKSPSPSQSGYENSVFNQDGDISPVSTTPDSSRPDRRTPLSVVGQSTPKPSTPRVALLRTNREGVVYADLALLNHAHKPVKSSRREPLPTEYATLKFHQSLDNAAAALQTRYQ